jgi:hypothetical protein
VNPYHNGLVIPLLWILTHVPCVPRSRFGNLEPKVRRISVDSWFGLLGRRASTDNRGSDGSGALNGSISIKQTGRAGSAELAHKPSGGVIDTAHISGPLGSTLEEGLAGACDAAISSIAQEVLTTGEVDVEQAGGQRKAEVTAVAASRAPSSEVPVFTKSSVITERPSDGSSTAGGKEKPTTGNTMAHGSSTAGGKQQAVTGSTAVGIGSTITGAASTAAVKDPLESHRPPRIATVDVTLSSIDAAPTPMNGLVSPQAQRDRLESLLKVGCSLMLGSHSVTPCSSSCHWVRSLVDPCL